MGNRLQFTEASELVDSIDSEINGLQECLGSFRGKNAKINQEIAALESAESKESPLWDILSLPSVLFFFGTWISSILELFAVFWF